MSLRIPTDESPGDHEVRVTKDLLNRMKNSNTSGSQSAQRVHALLVFLVIIIVYMPIGWTLGDFVSTRELAGMQGLVRQQRGWMQMAGQWMIPLSFILGLANLTSSSIPRPNRSWPMLLLFPKAAFVWFGVIEIGGFPISSHPHYSNDWAAIIQLVLGLISLASLDRMLMKSRSES